jgi:actin-like ATPase involved in cell morphogenesis
MVLNFENDRYLILNQIINIISTYLTRVPPNIDRQVFKWNVILNQGKSSMKQKVDCTP